MIDEYAADTRVHTVRDGLLREVALAHRYRKPILTNLAIVVVAAVSYSLLTPKIYEAHTSLLPAEDAAQGIGGLATLLRELPIQGANLPGVTTTTDLLAGILRSRRIQDPIIEAFDLIEVYEADHIEGARLTFDDRLRTRVSDEGILHVRFRDREPERAAAVLNRMVSELDDYNVNVRKTRSRQTREFISRRLGQTGDSLVVAEDRLKTYQEKHGVAITPEQMSAAESVGDLVARRFALRVELDALGSFMNDSAPPYQQRVLELGALDREIGRLPELGLTAVRYYRDLKVQEQLFLYLSAQLEQARIDESRDLPMVQVLDMAEAPVLRAWPQRKLIVLCAFVVGIVVSLLLAHVLDLVRRERDTLQRLFAQPPA